MACVLQHHSHHILRPISHQQVRPTADDQQLHTSTVQGADHRNHSLRRAGTDHGTGRAPDAQGGQVGEIDTVFDSDISNAGE